MNVDGTERTRDFPTKNFTIDVKTDWYQSIAKFYRDSKNILENASGNILSGAIGAFFGYSYKNFKRIYKRIVRTVRGFIRMITKLWSRPRH
jgi:hypothetical protein